MPTSMTFAEHGENIGTAGTVLRAQAGATSLTAPVPSCPGWTVLDLVAHTGAVYHWAAAMVRGEMDADGSAYDVAEKGARESRDLLQWFDDALALVLHEIASTPADRELFFFLKDAPDKRLGWARRQGHESAIHAVDAMAARLGRLPSANEVWLKPATAVDGIDELLTGFLPRNSSRVRAEEPLTLAVRCLDMPAAWTVRLSQNPAVVSVGEPEGPVDASVVGDAVPLYLALWNRGDEVTWSDPAIEALWRTRATILW